MLTEGKIINGALAGLTGLALTGGTVLGLNEFSKAKHESKSDTPVMELTVTKPARNDIKPVKKPKIPVKSVNVNNNWIFDTVVPFLIQWEGKVLNKSGEHVLYDDDVNQTVKRRWNGKGGQAGIERFIKSCVGKPTIGYGCTDNNVIRKGVLSDSEAKSILTDKINELNKLLYKRHPHIWGRLTAQQRTALISFYYNLGKFFKAPKMVKNLNAGNLSGAAHEFLDCDNTTLKDGTKVKCPGLTRRRAAEAKLLAN